MQNEFSYKTTATFFYKLLSIALQALTSTFTASTDLSNIACSSLFIWISIIRSTPPAPMTVGTPTYIPLSPSSPSTCAAQGKTRF